MTHAKMTRLSWTAAMEAQLIAGREAGLSHAEMAAKLSTTVRAVASRLVRLKRADFVPREKRKPLHTQLDQFKRWVMEEYRTDKWIAGQLQMSIHTIENFRRENGIQPARYYRNLKRRLVAGLSEHDSLNGLSKDDRPLSDGYVAEWRAECEEADAKLSAALAGGSFANDVQTVSTGKLWRPEPALRGGSQMASMVGEGAE